MAYLSVQGLSKRYGEAIAVQDFSLEVEQGAFVSLLGPSGSGKSSVLRMIAGLAPVDAGSVAVDGQDVTALPARYRRFGYVFQSYALFPHLSARRNVAFPLQVARVPRNEREETVERLLHTVGLGDKGSRLPHQLSGGEQQRVALARALAMRPSLLLLDEPLSALDARVRSAMRAEIKRLQREFGVTTLFVTHDQAEALALSDVVVVMNRGCIEQTGTPQEIYHSPETDFVASFVGETNRLRARVVEPGAGVAEWRGKRLIAAGALGRDPGSTIDLHVRPEAIRLVPPQGEEPVGEVTSVSFHGAFQRVTLDVAGEELTVDLPSAHDIRAGERLSPAFAESV